MFDHEKKLFGSLLDLNHDGKISLTESLIGHELLMSNQELKPDYDESDNDDLFSSEENDLDDDIDSDEYYDEIDDTDEDDCDDIDDIDEDDYDDFD